MSKGNKGKDRREQGDSRSIWIMIRAAVVLGIVIIAMAVQLVRLNRQGEQNKSQIKTEASVDQEKKNTKEAEKPAGTKKPEEEKIRVEHIRKDLDPEKPMVALTFDDGPKAGVTDVLLDELEKRNVKATFFLIGSQADLPENRETIRRMAEDGHQIGCHTYHHVQMTALSENQQKQEILQWYQVVSGIIGDFSYALRPPYGCVNNAVCRSLNVPVILWSVDTEDWTGKSAGEIADYVISETKDGDIILLHDIFEESVQGAVMALDDLMSRGYTFVTVNDLLADRGIAIQSGKVYRQAAQGGK